MRALRTSSDDSGNHRWRILGWRELNPRPKFLHTIFIIEKIDVYELNQPVTVILFSSVLLVFNVLPPKCRHPHPRDNGVKRDILAG